MSPLRRLAAGSLLLAALPSIARGQTTYELHLEALGQASAGGNIPWDSAQGLSWSSFRGRPHPGLFQAAETHSNVTYLIGCLGQETRFTVLATFSTTESWVRPDVVRDSVASVRTLQHERTHFELTEILARELRRSLLDAKDLCPGQLQRARELFDSLSSVSKAWQSRYDTETVHGTNLESQARWTRAISAELDSLAAFAEPPPQT